jgi:hypothetical protein
MKTRAVKHEEVERAAVRLVGARAPDQFTLIETIIAEIRDMPEDEPVDGPGVPWHSVEASARRRRNDRREAARRVAYEQFARAILSDPRLRHYLTQAGL